MLQISKMRLRERNTRPGLAAGAPPTPVSWVRGVCLALPFEELGFCLTAPTPPSPRLGVGLIQVLVFNY